MKNYSYYKIFVEIYDVQAVEEAIYKKQKNLTLQYNDR